MEVTETARGSDQCSEILVWTYWDETLWSSGPGQSCGVSAAHRASLESLGPGGFIFFFPLLDP